MEPTPAERPRWDRFGLLEIMLLIAAVALGGAGFARMARFFPLQGFVGMLAFGWLFSGPLILIGQFFRGRRVGLSVGEWFWITPTIGFILYPLLILCLPIMLGQWLAALPLLLNTIDGRRAERPCRWTDAMGLINALLVVPMTTFILVSSAFGMVPG